MKPSTRPALIEVPIADLVWPHRLDIVARFEALKAIDEDGLPAISTTVYYAFMDLPRGTSSPTDPTTAAASFVAAFNSIRSNGFDYSRPIIVQDFGGPHPAVWPLNRNSITQIVPSRYSLLRGAHRLAVLWYLGAKSVRVKAVTAEHPVPDYTTLMNLRGLRLEDESPTEVPDWPNPVPENEVFRLECQVTALELELHEKTDQVLEKASQLQAYERCIDDLLATISQLEHESEVANELVRTQEAKLATLRPRLAEAKRQSKALRKENRHLVNSRSYRIGHALLQPARAVRFLAKAAR